MRVSRIGSRALSAFLIVFYLVGVVAISASTHHTNSRNFGYWFRNYGAGNLNEVVINKTFSRSGKLPLEKIEGIYGLGLKGSIELHSKTSLVRVILVDNNLKEHLLYEAYPLIAPGSSFTVENVCEETCVLKSINPRSLKWQIIDASIHIDKLIFFTSFPGKENITKLKRQIKEDQNEAKIEKINNQIERRGLKWHAGKTSISGLFYEEKKELFSKDKVPNLQGAEFYKGGILQVSSSENNTSFPKSTSIIASFDWRNRHGANDPDSPYYDGDASGSGWITPVKQQECNHCWAFAPLHATEAIVNLYFNQHLDLDLSEQDVASCSGGNVGCCDGGYKGTALNYIINTGVVDEGCFPYSASCESCDNKCSDPNEQIKISGKLYPESNEEAIKRAIIDYGPITGGILSWWHVMVMIGFDKDPDDGETIWIFKNSWGTDWGDNGYGYLKVELNDMYSREALLTPVTSLKTPYEIACYDKDGDGYYNWGVSENKPATCPANAPSEKDCDDSNPCFGPFDSDGSCVLICQAPAAPSDLSANTVSSSQIDLSWQDNSGNEDGFKIYRDGSQIDTVGANTTSYSDTGLSSNTEYCYRVSASNSAGESSKSNQNCATTSVSNNPPDKPTNASPSDGATDVSLTPTLESSAISDPEGDSHQASQWQICSDSGCSNVIHDSGEDTSNLTSYTVPSGTLQKGTTYYWHVRYKDSAGAWSDYSNTTSFTTFSQLYAYFSYSLESVDSSGNTFTLSFQAEIYPDNLTIDSAHWTFGDGIEADGSNVTHTFNGLGKTYSSILTVEAGGSTDSYQERIWGLGGLPHTLEEALETGDLSKLSQLQNDLSWSGSSLEKIYRACVEVALKVYEETNQYGLVPLSQLSGLIDKTYYKFLPLTGVNLKHLELSRFGESLGSMVGQFKPLLEYLPGFGQLFTQKSVSSEEQSSVVSTITLPELYQEVEELTTFTENLLSNLSPVVNDDGLDLQVPTCEGCSPPQYMSLDNGDIAAILAYISTLKAEAQVLLAYTPGDPVMNNITIKLYDDGTSSVEGWSTVTDIIENNFHNARGNEVLDLNGSGDGDSDTGFEVLPDSSLTLRDGTMLGKARDNLVQAIEWLKLAIQDMPSSPDTHDPQIQWPLEIYWPWSEGQIQVTKQDLLDPLNALQDSLQGLTQVDIDIDLDGTAEYTTEINLAALVNNPINDLKMLLPDLVVTSSSDDPLIVLWDSMEGVNNNWKVKGSVNTEQKRTSIDLPDPSLHGVLPNEDSDEIATLLTFGEVIGEEETKAVFRVTKEGNVYADQAYYGQDFLTGGADIAEHIEVSEPVEPGDVVALDPSKPGHYRKSNKPYSTLASGVISTQPGFTLGLDRSQWNSQTVNLSLLFNSKLILENFSLDKLSKLPTNFAEISLELELSLKNNITQKRISQEQMSLLTLSLTSLEELLSQEYLEQTLAGKPMLALMGVVPVKATTDNGPIKVGDLLTTSSMPGYAMVCKDKEKCTGAIIGKALEPLEEGTSIIKMLVMR